METGKRAAGLVAVLVGLAAGLTVLPEAKANAPRPRQEQKQARVEGSGHVISEDRTVSGFHAVGVGGIGTLTITQGDRESLKIEAEDNILPYIVSEVKDGRLELGIKSHSDIHPTEPIRYTLTVKSLDALSASGATTVEAGALNASDRFTVTASGAAKIKLTRLGARALKVNLSGAGHLDLSGGGVETQEIEISGAGHYGAEGLKSREATVNASGAGHALVAVSDALAVHASGASSVLYVGSPKVTRSTSGVASVASQGGN